MSKETSKYICKIEFKLDKKKLKGIKFKTVIYCFTSLP